MLLIQHKKSINMNNQFIPMTMEQDISQRQALAQKADAAKFGYDPQVSTSAQVISFINKVNFLLGIIASLFATPLGMVVGVALNLMLYKAIEGWTQILDVKDYLDLLTNEKFYLLLENKRQLLMRSRSMKIMRLCQKI